MAFPKIKRCCSQHCYFSGLHWGNIIMIDEDGEGGAIHGCKAHVNATLGEEPYPPPEGCDTIREDDEQE